MRPTVPLHPKTETTTTVNKALKTTKRDSHLMKKASSSSSSSSSTSTSSLPSQQRRRQSPVIHVYTETQRIIHIDACNFMDLVQRLTGLHRRSEDQPSPKQDNNNEESETSSLSSEISYSDSCCTSSDRMESSCSPLFHLPTSAEFLYMLLMELRRHDSTA